MKRTINFALTSIDGVAERLENVRWKNDGGLTALCPVHDDHRNSLSVTVGDKGRPIFHCHSGCSYDEIIDALRDASSSPSDASRKKPVRAKAKPSDGMKRAHFVGPNTPKPDFEDILGRKPEATYRYANPQDRTVGYVVRMKGKDGKRFYQITPWRDGDGTLRWLIEDFAKPRPLYGLAELGQAEDDEPVLVVEGEKAADAAQSLFPSHIVISWHGGARAVRHSDWLPLQGFDVVIWPDADEPGVEAAEDIARTLRSVGAASVKIVELPDILPKGWDLADEVPEGVDIKALVRNAKPSEENLTNFLLSAKTLAGLDIPPRDMIVVPFIASNSINLMYARRGLGKTWVGLTLAKAVALGEDFLAYAVPEARPVLFIDGEMPLADLQTRVKAIGAGDIDNFEILSSEILHRDLHALNINREEDRELITAMLDRMAEEGRKPALIIIDNLSSMRMGVEENDNSALDLILLWLLSLRHKGYAILLVHHASKSGDQRGASRLEDLLDTTIKLSPAAEPSDAGASLELEFTKTRGVIPQPAHLTLHLVEDDDDVLEWDFGQAHKMAPQDHTLRAIYNGSEGDGSVPFEKQKDLTKATGLRPPAISKHLAYLRRDELVDKGSLTVTDGGKARLANLFPGETFE
ncbi:MAG: AAA family ATPase [Notoacmeibacter sp.]|nr:AAA family ATPase [Notoacmeibacter sp.]